MTLLLLKSTKLCHNNGWLHKEKSLYQNISCYLWLTQYGAPGLNYTHSNLRILPIEDEAPTLLLIHAWWAWSSVDSIRAWLQALLPLIWGPHLPTPPSTSFSWARISRVDPAGCWWMLLGWSWMLLCWYWRLAEVPRTSRFGPGFHLDMEEKESISTHRTVYGLAPVAKKHTDMVSEKY